MSTPTESLVAMLQNDLPAANAYVQAIHDLSSTLGNLENLGPPAGAGNYAGSAGLQAHLDAAKTAAMAWPNTVGPACHNTPTIIVNWDPSLQATILLLQGLAGQPSTTSRNQQIQTAAAGILSILGNSKRAIDALVAGLSALAQTFASGSLPFVSDLQKVQRDFQDYQGQLGNLFGQLHSAQHATSPDKGKIQGLVSEISSFQNASQAASLWVPVLNGAVSDMRRASPSLNYLNGIWVTLNRDLDHVIAAARLIQQNPATIDSFEIAAIDQSWMGLKSTMQGISQGLQ